MLETDVVDDAYFSALLGAAKAEARTSMDAAERTSAGTRPCCPGGRHLQDAAEVARPAARRVRRVAPVLTSEGWQARWKLW